MKNIEFFPDYTEVFYNSDFLYDFMTRERKTRGRRISRVVYLLLIL